MARIGRMALLLVIVSVSAALAASTWTRYVNARYGYGIDVPPGFAPRSTAANDDGLVFLARDGAVLTVWGSNNVLGETVDVAFEGALHEKDRVIVRKERRPDGFVVAWREKGSFRCHLQRMGKGSTDAFLFVCPIAREAAYAKVVTRLEASFKAGDLTRSH